MRLLNTYLHNNQWDTPHTFELVYRYRRYDGYTEKNVYLEGLGEEYPDNWFDINSRYKKLCKEDNETNKS